MAGIRFGQDLAVFKDDFTKTQSEGFICTFNYWGGILLGRFIPLYNHYIAANNKHITHYLSKTCYQQSISSKSQTQY